LTIPESFLLRAGSVSHMPEKRAVEKVGDQRDGIPGQLVGGESDPGLALTGGSGHA
jgi:hypothetical protein